MQPTQTNIISPVLITSVVVLFILAGFIFLITHYRKRYNGFYREKAEMYQQFKETLFRSQLEIQEQTLNNIGQEIHDNIGQELGVVKIQLNIIEQLRTFDEGMLKEAMKNLDSAIVSLREVAESMNTALLQNFSLEENIQNLCNRINRTRVLKILIETKGDKKLIQGSTGLITFRIVQECVQNICRHSKANTAWIEVCYGNDTFEVSVRDNGIGFNREEEQNQRKGSGLLNIINRTSVLGGEAIINSTLYKGTFIKLIMPYG